MLDGGFGFAVAGTLELRDAVLARSVDAAGVVRGPGAVLVAERIAYVDNATDEVVTDEALPEASALPAPTGICVGPPCP